MVSVYMLCRLDRLYIEGTLYPGLWDTLFVVNVDHQSGQSIFGCEPQLRSRADTRQGRKTATMT
jgi:hypothetical protein